MILKRGKLKLKVKRSQWYFWSTLYNGEWVKCTRNDAAIFLRLTRNKSEE